MEKASLTVLDFLGFADGGLLARVIENSKFPDLPYVILESAPCAPHPTVVEVPQPEDSSSFYFPFFVTLYRCGGACNERPFETSCQPEGRWLEELAKQESQLPDL